MTSYNDMTIRSKKVIQPEKNEWRIIVEYSIMFTLWSIIQPSAADYVILELKIFPEANLLDLQNTATGLENVNFKQKIEKLLTALKIVVQVLK